MPAPKKKASGVRTSIRFDPPSLEEAIFAAQGLTDIVDDQAAIAASLMGLPEADVKAALLKSDPPRPRSLAACPSKCNLRRVGHRSWSSAERLAL